MPWPEPQINSLHFPTSLRFTVGKVHFSGLFAAGGLGAIKNQALIFCEISYISLIGRFSMGKILAQFTAIVLCTLH